MKRDEMQKRNNRIALMVQFDHMNFEEIGDCFGLTKEAVRRILLREGIDYQIVLERRRNLGLSSQFDGPPWANLTSVYLYGPNQGKTRPEYEAYMNMFDRCYNPKHPGYENWGGRGITVCDRWSGEHGFMHFLFDMGERPPGVYPSGRAIYSIHRIDNDGPYTPENCKWATPKEQCANRRPPVRKANPMATPTSSEAQSAAE